MGIDSDIYMIETKDNFLNDIYFQGLVKEFTSDLLPWYLQHHVSIENDGHIQMTHNIYKDSRPTSNAFDLMMPLIKQLNICALIRIKLNLLYRTEKTLEHGWHIDISDAPKIAKTAVLYLNTNNGYTKFEDGTKVESIANRIVIFPNNLKHTGATNTCETPYRLVLNIDYMESEDNGV